MSAASGAVNETGALSSICKLKNEKMGRAIMFSLSGFWKQTKVFANGTEDGFLLYDTAKKKFGVVSACLPKLVV